MSTFTTLFSKATVKNAKAELKAASKGRTAETKAAAKATWKEFRASGLKAAKAELKTFKAKAKEEIKALKKAKAAREEIKYCKLVLKLTNQFFKLYLKSLKTGVIQKSEFEENLAGLLLIAAYTLKHPSERGLETAASAPEISDKELEEDEEDEVDANDDPNEIPNAQVISEQMYDQFGNLAEGGEEKIIKITRSTDNSVKPCPDPYCLPQPSVKVLSSGSYCQSMTKYQEPSSGGAARRTVHNNIVDVIADNLFMEAIINGEIVDYEQCYAIAQKLVKER